MIRHATETDLPRILEIYDIARRFMRQNGNMVQWVNGYPSEALLRADVAGYELEHLADGHYRALHRQLERALADGALGVSLLSYLTCAWVCGLIC